MWRASAATVRSSPGTVVDQATVTSSPPSASGSAARAPSRPRAVADDRDRSASAGSPRCRSRSARGRAGSGTPTPRRAGSAGRPGRRRGASRCGAVDEHRLVARRHQDDAREAAQVGDVDAPWCVGPSSRRGRRDRSRGRRGRTGGRRRGRSGRMRAAGRSSRWRDRPRALERQPGREQQRLLLGDADVEVAVRHRLLQDVQAGAGVHRGGDPDDARGRAGTRDQGSPNTCVYCGLAALAARLGRRRRARRRSVGLAACHFSMPSRPPSSAGAKPLPLTVAMCTTTGRSASNAALSARAQRAHVVAVDDADVGPVELLPEQPGRPERLDRLLQLRAEALERGADARRAAS